MSPLLLFFLVGVILVVLYLYKNQYHRNPAAPPYYPGLPLLGHAISFGKNGTAFLDACRKESGDLFTVYLAGTKRTFLLDPLVFPSVFKNSTTWTFHDFAKEVSVKAFKISESTYDTVDKSFHNQYISFLSGKALVPLTLSLQKQLYQHMVNNAKEQLQEWQTDQLFNWTRQVIFYGSGDSLFGDNFSNQQVLSQFYTYDDKFALFLAGLPSVLYKSAVDAHAKLCDWVVKRFEHGSTWFDARQKTCQDLGVPVEQFAALQSSMLWASQANTVPACFWIIAHILADAKARKEITEEIEQVMSTVEKADDLVTFTSEKLAEMVKLDSAISEVLRLHSAPFMIRGAQQDAEVTLTDGQSYTLPKGSILIMSPNATHRDAEVYAKPNEFQFKRFVDDPKFFKGGQLVKTPLLPFGGGVSLCPGRHFARNEMKVFVAFTLYYFDLELLESSLPPDNWTRSGLGMLPPEGDVPFRYRLRHQRAKSE